jgi:hypothetical protein
MAEIRAGAAANSVDYVPHTDAVREGGEGGARGLRYLVATAGEGRRRKKQLLGSRSVYLPAYSAPARRRGFILSMIRYYCIFIRAVALVDFTAVVDLRG